MSIPTFRFAPSPNGELHLGHALSALANRQLAERMGGRLLLRVENIDAARCTPEFEAAMLRDLEWLGFAWEKPIRRQSEHFADYASALDRLIAQDLVYPAFMSRGEVRAQIAAAESAGRPWPRDPDGVPLYPGLDRSLGPRERQRRIGSGEPFAWRLDMARAMEGLSPGDWAWSEAEDGDLARLKRVEASPAEWGDVVLARREVPTSYHLSVVVDDALQEVTHVVRGRDLYSATSVQRLLQRHLGLTEPVYFHHRLVLGPDGRKLSKSNLDTGLRALRESGVSAEAVCRQAQI